MACTDGGPEPETQQDRAPIAFDRTGGDVFSWSEKVTGRARCPEVAIQVNGEPLDAPVGVTGSAFSATVPIRPGSNLVVARCATGQDAEGAAAEVGFEGRLQERPTARIDVSIRGGIVTLDGRRSEPTQPDGSKVVRYTWTSDPRHPARMRTAQGRAFSEESGAELRLRAPTEDGEYYVALEVFDRQGRSDRSVTYFVVEDGEARVVDMRREHPAWIDRAIVYAPIAQLWGNGGPKSVERRLSYLKDLGVDALWLWPPATLRATGEEYAITDYFELDPSWGPMRAFKDMVDEAHRLGLHVLLDFVPNHMSDQSPYFQEAEELGEASRYWDFFDRGPNGEHTYYFDWTNLPNLNYENPEVRRMVVESMSYWVRDVGIDGFRVDVAWGVKRRRPNFWPHWREELKRINPDLLLIAEATAVDPYYFSHGFDVGYDWTNSPGQWAWTSAFEFPEESGALLAPAITNGDKGYAPDAVVMRFLNNNDTGVRFVDQYGPELTRVAATLQFTVPGVPAMFAGDEIGASYEPYSNLTPIPWRDRFRLRPFYKRLIDLKHGVPAFNSNTVHVLTANVNSVLAYVRPAVGDSGPVLVILNFGSKGRVEIEPTPALEAVLDASGGAFTDLLTGERVSLEAGSGPVGLSMPAESSLVLVPGSA